MRNCRQRSDPRPAEEGARTPRRHLNERGRDRRVPFLEPREGEPSPARFLVSPPISATNTYDPKTRESRPESTVGSTVVPRRVIATLARPTTSNGRTNAARYHRGATRQRTICRATPGRTRCRATSPPRRRERGRIPGDKTERPNRFRHPDDGREPPDPGERVRQDEERCNGASIHYTPNPLLVHGSMLRRSISVVVIMSVLCSSTGAVRGADTAARLPVSRGASLPCSEL